MFNQQHDNVRKNLIAELGSLFERNKILFCLAGRTGQDLRKMGDIYVPKKIDDIDFRVQYKDYDLVTKLRVELEKIGFSLHNWRSRYKLQLEKNLFVEIHFLHHEDKRIFFRKGDEDDRKNFYWPSSQFPPSTTFNINGVNVPIEPAIRDY